MPILATADPAITSLQGIHLYHAGISNCSNPERDQVVDAVSWSHDKQPLAA
jgi:hypothetical protein